MSIQFAYRYEKRPLRVDAERTLIEELGEAGWELVCYVNHWGPHDGRMMLFKRRVG